MVIPARGYPGKVCEEPFLRHASSMIWQRVG
jgi:hypothetical protein